MGARTAAGTSLVEVAVIGVACKDYVTRMVGDATIWVRGNIVEELVDSVRSGLGGRGLLGSNGAESKEKLVVDRASVPQEGVNDTSDVFNAVHVEWRERIKRCGLLGIGTIGDG